MNTIALLNQTAKVMPEEEYHAGSGLPSDGKYLSASLVKLFRSDGPRAFYEATQGRGKPYPTPVQNAMEFGTAVHDAALMGTPYTHPEVRRVAAAARPAIDGLAGDGRRFAERVLTGTLCGLPFHCRLDLIVVRQSEQVLLSDLKTYRYGGDFSTAVRRYQYVEQMAIYRQILSQNLGIVPAAIETSLIPVEKPIAKTHPTARLAANVIPVDPQKMDEAFVEVMVALEEIKACIARDRWPETREEIKLPKC